MIINLWRNLSLKHLFVLMIVKEIFRERMVIDNKSRMYFSALGDYFSM